MFALSAQAGNFVYVKPAALTCSGIGCALSAQIKTTGGVSGTGATDPTNPTPPADPTPPVSADVSAAISALSSARQSVLVNIIKSGPNQSASGVTSGSFYSFTVGSLAIPGSVMDSGASSNAWTIGYNSGTTSLIVVRAGTGAIENTDASGVLRHDRIIGQSEFNMSSVASMGGFSISACAAIASARIAGISCGGGVASASASLAEAHYYTDPNTGVTVNTFPSAP